MMTDVMKPHPHYYTRRDLSATLLISQSTIKRHEKTGALKATHVGPRIVRYHETDVEEFLKRRTDNPPDEDHP
jgi:predicted DNA-binding transcriptional regulator AlpA